MNRGSVPPSCSPPPPAQNASKYPHGAGCYKFVYPAGHAADPAWLSTVFESGGACPCAVLLSGEASWRLWALDGLEQGLANGLLAEKLLRMYSSNVRFQTCLCSGRPGAGCSGQPGRDNLVFSDVLCVSGRNKDSFYKALEVLKREVRVL